MDSKTLLESSLRTCPRSAKSNVELSKIYSGLYPAELDLKKALWYLEQGEDIDPNFCDMHHQFAMVYYSMGRVLEFEERNVKGVLCQFSMHQAYDHFQTYWEHTLGVDRSVETRQRYEKYRKILNDEVMRQDEQSKREKKGKGQGGSVEDEL